MDFMKAIGGTKIMKGVGRLGGVLYYKDIPVLNFKFDGGYPVKYEVLNDKYLPFELKLFGVFDGLISFFDDRCTPDTRIGIHELISKTPIQFYDKERLLRYCHGQCIHDCFWIEQDDDISCWKGSPLEGIGVASNTDWNNILTSLKFKD